jgi:hypothetical protein
MAIECLRLLTVLLERTLLPLCARFTLRAPAFFLAMSTPTSLVQNCRVTALRLVDFESDLARVPAALQFLAISLRQLGQMPSEAAALELLDAG